MGIVVAACVNPPAFAYVVVGPILWAHSSHPRGGRPFPGVGLSWGDSSTLLVLVSASVLLVSAIVLLVSAIVLVDSPLHLLLALALPVLLPLVSLVSSFSLVSSSFSLVSSFSRSRGLSSSRLSHPSSSSLSSRPLPPSRVARLLLIVSSSSSFSSPRPCSLSPHPSSVSPLLAIVVSPSGFARCQRRRFGPCCCLGLPRLPPSPDPTSIETSLPTSLWKGEGRLHLRLRF